MARRNATVLAESEIIDDYSPPRKGRRPRNQATETRRPANPWVPLDGYTPARPVEAPVRDWPDLAYIYEEKPPYAV